MTDQTARLVRGVPARFDPVMVKVSPNFPPTRWWARLRWWKQTLTKESE